MCLLASCIPMIPPLLRHIKQKRQDRSNNLHRQRDLVPLLRLGPINKTTQCSDNIVLVDRARCGRNSGAKEDPYLLDDTPGNKFDQIRLLVAHANQDHIIVSGTVSVSSAPFSEACDLEPMSEAHIGAQPRSEYP